MLQNMAVSALSLLDDWVLRCCVGWNGGACVFLTSLSARAAACLRYFVRRSVFPARWVLLKLLDTAVSGTVLVADVFSMLSVCTHRGVLELRYMAISALSV